MAREYKPTPIGLRIAASRKRSNLSAAALAERVPDGSLTRAMITNIETGRKPEPTVGEILKIASALRMSPMALIIGVDAPWATVNGTSGISGLAEPYADMTVAEYARATNIYSERSTPTEVINRLAVQFLDRLNDAEAALAKHEFIESMLADDETIRELKTNMETGTYTSYTVLSVAGERASVFDTEVDDDGWWQSAQDFIDAFRAVSSILYNNDRSIDPLRFPKLPSTMRERIITLRRAFVDLVTQQPSLDFGQDDRNAGLNWGALPLDPSTGEPKSREL